MNIIHGDCVEAMCAMPDSSVDAIVTDPPYGLGFMGKAWDALPPGLPWARECLRVIKPGGHIVAFGGQRTIHRLTCALEDAGWEIRDLFGWLQWQGFPKSHDISKAIDREAGAVREVVGFSRGRSSAVHDGGQTVGMDDPITAPATPSAIQWQGWGTALKPALEPAIIARKPLSESTIARNVQRWGTGALNIDGCRYGFGDRAWPGPQAQPPAVPQPSMGVSSGVYEYGTGTGRNGSRYNNTAGRFPANVYMCPKASRSERERGCEHLPPTNRAEITGRVEGSAGQTVYSGITTQGDIRNGHPTVKPVELMRWLCRLVTPPGGIVLDTFLGSGTTGVAAVLEGLDFVGIEREHQYVQIARARIGYAQGHAPEYEPPPATDEDSPFPNAVQMGLF